MEDKELIRRCQFGEKAAFQELISLYHPFVFRFLVKLTESNQLSEDLAQDVFLKVIRNIDKFDIGGKATFSTYLMTIAKNTYIDYLRKEKKLAVFDPLEHAFRKDEIISGFEDSAVDRIYSQNIMEQFEYLTEEQRTAIKLKYVEGLTLKEIGEMLQVEPKTVKSRIHNGIAKLKKILIRGEKDDGSF
ncbi:MAG: sigma-70 family RNA polymerase sigma factor [Peptococcaceae bacterium]|nr:sigma-70 family RNA polymerase sigma factor [Peptococcaceae bacterium]